MKPLSLKTVAVLCAAASAATIACAAMAQNGPPPPGGRGGQAGQGQPRDGGRLGPAGGDRMQQLHDALKLTTAQEAGFQAWQTALKPPAPPAARANQALRGMTTPQRLDEALSDQTKRDAELKTRVAATKSFYNQLSVTQRQTLDAVPPQQLLGMTMGGRGGRGGALAERGGPRGPGGPAGRRGGGLGPDGGFGGPPPQ